MSWDYYGPMDKLYYGKLEPNDNPRGPENKVEVSSLTPADFGKSTNPMMHQVQSFSARIREGAGRIEIGFLGAGKTNAQQPSPEAFGSLDRQDIRALAEINKVNTSVHAALHGESLAGLGREGFSGEARQNALKEIERAIQFSAEATKGGAIVFHTGEWQRPIVEVSNKDKGLFFKGYEEEEKRSPKYIVDSRTGELNGIRKDHLVYEPEFITAEKFEKDNHIKIVGTKDKNGNLVEKNDWVDIDGNAIKRRWLIETDKAEELFKRVPIFQPNSTNFSVVSKKFEDFEKEAEQLNEELNLTGEKKITGEELFFKSNTANQVLQAKGQSLYHARQYEELKRARDAAIKALEFYDKLDAALPESEKWKIMTERQYIKFAPAEHLPIPKALREQIKDLDNNMRHIHESSAFADAQAKQALEKMNNIVSIEKYGLDKTADTISKAGLMAREYYNTHKKELNDPIYVAPENWRPEQFGSHPDEIRKIVVESRKAMAKRLQEMEGMSPEQAKEEAAKHIKATVDIGHFNMWKQHFQSKPGESTKDKNERFNKWAVNELGKLADDKIIGHIHIADNMGFDDEHLTPGQGNAPIKAFIERMEKAGIKDFIVENGSFNDATALPDTMALIGSPVYAAGGPRTFRSFRNQQFGYINPAAYIVGAYAPSNEWHLWSEVPFE